MALVLTAKNRRYVMREVAMEATLRAECALMKYEGWLGEIFAQKEMQLGMSKMRIVQSTTIPPKFFNRRVNDKKRKKRGASIESAAEARKPIGKKIDRTRSSALGSSFGSPW